MINFLHTFVPNPVAFSVGLITVRWYGIFIVAGIISGLAVTKQLAKKFNFSADQVYDLAFYVIIFSLLGARIFSIFLDFNYYINNPFQMLAVWNGGLAIHGGIIGGALTIYFYAKKKNQNFWSWIDVAAPGLALGQAIGRFGNYFNQEIFGWPTSLPWGIPIELANRPAQFTDSIYFHPTFLYEAILNLINFAILLILFKTRIEKLKAGTLALIYLINYSAIRILMEQLRTDSVPEIYGLRATTWSAMIILVIAIIALSRKVVDQRSKNNL